MIDDNFFGILQLIVVVVRLGTSWLDLTSRGVASPKLGMIWDWNFWEINTLTFLEESATNYGTSEVYLLNPGYVMWLWILDTSFDLPRTNATDYRVSEGHLLNLGYVMWLWI